MDLVAPPISPLTPERALFITVWTPGSFLPFVTGDTDFFSLDTFDATTGVAERGGGGRDFSKVGDEEGLLNLPSNDST
jgi:hypothetical protein